MVAGGGLYSYYIHQGNKSETERKIVRKKFSFMHTKRFNTFLKRWMQFRVVTIPRLPLVSSRSSYLVNVQQSSLTKVLQSNELDSLLDMDNRYKTLTVFLQMLTISKFIL